MLRKPAPRGSNRMPGGQSGLYFRVTSWKAALDPCLTCRGMCMSDAEATVVLNHSSSGSCMARPILIHCHSLASKCSRGGDRGESTSCLFRTHRPYY